MSSPAISGESTFNFDITRFFWTDQITQLEVHYAIPYNLFSYKKEGGKLTAPFRVRVEFENLDTGESLLDTMTRRSVIPSYKEAEKRNLLALEQFRLYCKPGSYRITFNVIDINTGQKITRSEMLRVDSLKEHLTLSDIELATSIETDTTKGRFTKNGLKVIPNPSGIYGAGRAKLYFYVEVYNIKKDSIPYEIDYTILDEKGNIVDRIGPNKKHKNLDIAIDIDIGGLNLVAFKAGFYTLRIQVKDGEDSAIAERNFQVHKKVAAEVRKTPFFTEEEKKYYKRIEYLSSEKELSFYKTLSDSGKLEFLKRFWLKRDINPATPENEGLAEFIKRIKYVEKNFSTSFKKGYSSDRGRIYIKYGAPDIRERHQFEVAYRPYEVWEYYSFGGYIFIFSDLSGDGAFQLIYSSTQKETSLPNWKKYVPENVTVMHGE